MKKIKVAVGLSGGVDSAVSAYLLKKQGFDISGVYLHCFDDDAPGCRGKHDRQDALKVALHLKIPFQVLDFRMEYKSAVINYFKKEYLAGRTPNPDVICNRDIKFGLFLDWAIKEGFDYVATGHYADVAGILRKQNSAATPAPRKLDTSEREAGSLQLKRELYWGANPVLRIPRDLHKDQTYFLWAIPKQNFSRVLFPLANYLKSEVRALASRLAPLSGVADKPDSTGICFIGEVRVEDFLKRLGVKEKVGEVVIQAQKVQPFEAKVIGRHKGVAFYTIGQRHGFSTDLLPSSLFPLPSADHPPFYVIAKDIKTNRLVVGFGPECYRDQFEIADCNWLIPEKDSPSGTGRTVLCRIRHLGSLIPCRINASTHQRINVSLSQPQRGVAPGQSAVFYSKDGIVLGGGVIQ